VEREVGECDWRRVWSRGKRKKRKKRTTPNEAKTIRSG